MSTALRVVKKESEDERRLALVGTLEQHFPRFLEIEGVCGKEIEKLVTINQNLQSQLIDKWAGGNVQVPTVIKELIIGLTNQPRDLLFARELELLRDAEELLDLNQGINLDCWATCFDVLLKSSKVELGKWQSFLESATFELDTARVSAKISEHVMLWMYRLLERGAAISKNWAVDFMLEDDIAEAYRESALRAVRTMGPENQIKLFKEIRDNKPLIDDTFSKVLDKLKIMKGVTNNNALGMTATIQVWNVCFYNKSNLRFFALNRGAAQHQLQSLELIQHRLTEPLIQLNLPDYESDDESSDESIIGGKPILTKPSLR